MDIGKHDFYNKTFNKIHTVGLTLMQSAEYYRTEGLDARAYESKFLQLCGIVLVILIKLNWVLGHPLTSNSVLLIWPV